MPLTYAQANLLENMERFPEGVIVFYKPRYYKIWRYFIALRSLDGCIYSRETPVNTNMVKCLIRKGVLVPEISNKEWEVQVALGTAPKGRVYK